MCSLPISRDRTVEAAAGDAPAPERTAGSIGRMRREAHFVLTSQDLDCKHGQRARRQLAILINADFDLWSTVRAPQGHRLNQSSVSGEAQRNEPADAENG
jgi:hypothetical protein